LGNPQESNLKPNRKGDRMDKKGKFDVYSRGEGYEEGIINDRKVVFKGGGKGGDKIRENSENPNNAGFEYNQMGGT